MRRRVPWCFDWHCMQSLSTDVIVSAAPIPPFGGTEATIASLTSVFYIHIDNAYIFDILHIQSHCWNTIGRPFLGSKKPICLTDFVTLFFIYLLSAVKILLLSG